MRRPHLFYRGSEESLLSERTEGKEIKPEGFILALQGSFTPLPVLLTSSDHFQTHAKKSPEEDFRIVLFYQNTNGKPIRSQMIPERTGCYADIP